jgi:peptidoglycan/xylan/chitin deacetylase (PgdA/CDA1 family)
MHWLDPVERALNRASAPADVFFRDDDAGWDDDRLLALLDLFDHHALPLDLAVIPAALEPGLADELRARATVGLHQHGYAHRNHEPEGRRCEFGPSRPAAAQRRDIEAGARRLAELLGNRLDPIFTPPWNRCTTATGETLLQLGFRMLSRENRAEPLGLEGLAELPVAIDWVRLQPTEIAARLATALDKPQGPVGVMFHHAEMDRAHRGRAGELLGVLAAHPRSRPKPMRTLC